VALAVAFVAKTATTATSTDIDSFAFTSTLLIASVAATILQATTTRGTA